MNRLFVVLSFAVMLFVTSCDNLSSRSGDSVVGIWTEYREDGDTYLQSSWKFNSDGSGMFIVDGMSGNEKVPFTWTELGPAGVEVNMNGETQILEINNGLLIESGSLGTTVFKKL
jgi:hypothetical protein